MSRKFNIYRRSVDAGHGHQTVVTNENGKVLEQSLGSNGSHYYSGDGNPEFVGQNIQDLRGSGLRKVRMSDSQYSQWLEENFS